jgi:hypothetical protein
LLSAFDFRDCGFWFLRSWPRGPGIPNGTRIL